MAIYVVHSSLIPDGKYFNEMTNEEIVELYEKEENYPFMDRYDSIEEFGAYFNDDSIMHPSEAYMRVIQ